MTMTNTSEESRMNEQAEITVRKSGRRSWQVVEGGEVVHTFPTKRQAVNAMCRLEMYRRYMAGAK